MSARILYITPSAPAPPTSGDRQRTATLLRALLRCGDVDVLLVGTHAPDVVALVERVAPVVGVVAARAAGEFAPWSWARPLAPRVVDRLAHNLGSHARRAARDPAVAGRVGALLAATKYDAVVVRYLDIAARCGLAGDPRLVLDVDDLWTDRYRSRLAAGGLRGPARWVVRRHLRQYAAVEPGILAGAAWLWFVSEANLRDATPPGGRASLLPNVPYGERPPRPPRSPAASARVLFVGTVIPSVEPGLDALVRVAWPRVRARVPTATLRIVGRGVSDAARRAWSAVPGVEVVGFVDDVGAEYDACALTVAPMTSGSGTNIKVLESYAMGRACVATPAAHRGFERALPAGEAIAVAPLDAAFGEGIADLLLDAARRDGMAAIGQEAVRAEFSFESFAAAVRHTLAALDVPVRPGDVPAVCQKDGI